MGYSPCSCKESDTTERLSTDTDPISNHVHGDPPPTSKVCWESMDNVHEVHFSFILCKYKATLRLCQDYEMSSTYIVKEGNK